MTRQLIVDTETTGLSPQEGHRIIEVGCLEMINRRLTGNYYHQYINPERAIDREAEQVHGITTDFLKDKPRYAEIADALLAYIDGAELIIHNAPFDVGFLDHEFRLINAAFGSVADTCPIIDSLTLARRKHPGQRNNLDALCSRYSVDNRNRDLHGALLDAELLAQVYLLMTGGQTQLFGADEDTGAETSRASKIKRLRKNRQPLPVIMASDAELQAHQQFLERME